MGKSEIAPSGPSREITLGVRTDRISNLHRILLLLDTYREEGPTIPRDKVKSHLLFQSVLSIRALGLVLPTVLNQTPGRELDISNVSSDIY